MVALEERIETLADKIKRIYDQFGYETAIMAISMLKKSRALTQTSGFMTQIEDEAAKLWEKAVERCDEVYKQAKKTYDRGMQQIINELGYYPESVKQITQALCDKTTGSMYNQTRTIAETVQQDFIQAADYAHMEIVYGKKSVYDAVANAVSDVLKDTSNAFSRVTYPSGHSDAIEVAMLRAARTGGAQTAATVVERYCDDSNIALVEVSAHYGARPEHAVWQGKVYSLHGSTSKYPNLADATGYGTVTGLLGANCMHLYYPFMEGSERTYTDEQLREMQEEKLMYQDKEVPTYELIQKQRAFERSIRKQKQDILKNEAAGSDVTADKIRLKNTQNRLKRFLDDVGFTRRPQREEVYGWDRSHAAQVGAMQAAQTRFNSALISVGKTSTGIKIADISDHVYDRAKERNVKAVDMTSALTSPLKTSIIRADKSQQFIGEKATVVINSETGKVVTVWPTSSDKAKKLKGDEKQ